MKRTLLMTLMLVFTLGLMAQNAAPQAGQGKKPAQIKFDKTTHDFGDFSEKNPVQTYNFTFTNIGDEPLVINQALAACGCTVPKYTKEPIQPGEKGEIKVTYNGEGQWPGHIRKSVTVYCNGEVPMTRLYITGNLKKAE